MSKIIKNPKIGDKAGRLTLVNIEKRVGLNNKIRFIFYCVCDCGKELNGMQPSSFGNKRSCGCLIGDKAHGKSHTKVWAAWQKMKSRCYNKNCPKYPSYGGRGIFVCNGLQDFKHFYKIMGEPPTKTHSNDRIENNNGYSCGECDECIKNGWLLNIHWATPQEQAQNQRTNHKVIYNGEIMCLVEAARRAVVPYKRVFNRITYCGWSVEEALSNKKSLKEKIIINGMSLEELAKKYDVKKSSLRDRLIRNDWDIVKAMAAPIIKKK